MPNLSDRPYVGTWSTNNRPVVKHTPDMLIFVNGDTAIPGCSKCNGRIELQQFVKAVSIEAGVTPGSHSGQAQLTIPRNYGEQLFREGRGLLTPSLEVHIYMRGYFPTQGQFAHIPENEIQFGENSINLDKFVTYPYYHVFHGVVTNVNYEYSDGFYSASMSFASLLHFWQYHNMVMNGQYLGARVKNSSVNPSLKGNWFNNMSPFAIIYSLYRDLVGAAALQGHTLRSKTNFDAVSAVAGEGKQLYSLMLQYWEERFKTTIQSLRMYGVQGRLFNAVEQAFLARRNKGSIDRSLVKQDNFMASGTMYNVRDFSAAQRTLAKELGFERFGDDFVYGRLGPRGDSAQFDVLGITAFTQSMDDIASFDVMESTYQTKLDVAQTTANAINYEFYQDVDGDLVFKPPMYNLDTRGNRVYRIEDIDIISWSSQEKEPEATYCTITAGHLNNLTATGTEGWVGNRGTYYDYRLVAKFGWRPATEEVTYLNSAKQLFYLAQARLDLLNIDINSATVTIPLRPEIRPGFPVYITFLDTFYYVTALSHSFGFGAQCTTTLTLTARRSKFHAPGFIGPLREGENAIGRIALDRPDLPERPLEIYDNGLPRLQGFPNVVMALDPNKLNPKFFILGSGLEDLTTVDDVKLLFNIIREQVKTTGEGGGIFALAHGGDENAVPTEHTEYRLQQSDNPEDDITFSLSDLIRDFKSLDQARREINRLEKTIARKASDGRSSRGTKKSKIEAELASATQQLEDAAEKVELTRDPDKNKLAQLINALQRTDPIRRLGLGSGVKDGPTTASYLEMLGDLKSNLEIKGAAGYYRYFSCSHPDPSQQGQAILEFNDGTGSDLFEEQVITTDPGETLAAPDPDVPRTSLAVKTFGVNGDITDEEFRRQDNRRQGGFAKQKAKHLALANQMEQITGVEGLATYLHAQARGESRFQQYARLSGLTRPNSAVAVNETLRSTEQMLAQEIPRGQQTGSDVQYKLKAKNAKKFQEDFGRQPRPGEGVARRSRHAGNPHLFDGQGNVLPDAHLRWGHGSGGYYGLMPSAGMGAFRKPLGSKYANLPPEAIYDPIVSQVMNYNYLATTCKQWSGRARDGAPGPPGDRDRYKRDPPGKMTWGELRRAGGSFAQVGKGEFGTLPSDGRFLNKLQQNGMTREQALAFANTEVPCDKLLDPSLGRIGKYDALLDKLKGARELEVSPKEVKPQPKPPTKVEPSKPTIRKIEQKLPNPQSVLGFIDGPLERPDGVTRSPEAALGKIICENGFRILRAGRGGTAVVPTSEIQKFSLVQFEGVKRVDVLGFSKDKGNYSPADLKKFLTKYLSQRFRVAADQAMAQEDPTLVTPKIMLEETYNTIRDVLLTGKGSTADSLFADIEGFDFDPGSRAYPVYFRRLQGAKIGSDDRFQVEAIKVIELPTFDQAVADVQVTQQLESAAEDTLDLVEDAGVDAVQAFSDAGDNPQQGLDAFLAADLQFVPDVVGDVELSSGRIVVNPDAPATPDLSALTAPVATLPLTVLKASKRYASRKGKLDKTVTKIVEDYTKTIVTFVARAYTEARESAGYRKGKLPGGFTDRMRPVQDAFNQIAFDITQVPFQIEKGQFVYKASKTAKKRNPIFTPVYPVSDGGGYEHIGAFRYGRGLDVEKGGTFAQISTGDPLNGLTAESAEAYLNAKTAVIAIAKGGNTAAKAALRAQMQAATEALRQQVASADDEIQKIDQAAEQGADVKAVRDARIARYSQLKVILSRLAESNPEAVNEIAALNGIDPNVLVVDNPNPDQAGQFVTLFANTPATGTTEAPMKTTVSNAAYNLADLAAHITDEVNVTCRCRGSEASVLLSAYGRNDFIALDGIDPNEQPATAFVSEGILNGLQDYQFQRQALRGQVLDTEGSDLFEKFRQLKDIRNNIRNAGSQLRELGSEFKRTAASIGDIKLGGG